MSKWQPIDTAPKDGTPILIVRAGDGIDEIEITYWCQVEYHSYVPNGDGSYRRETEVDEFWNGNGHRATHWMPLPEPPEASDE